MNSTFLFLFFTFSSCGPLTFILSYLVTVTVTGHIDPKPIT
jgi:hypothetical protein